MSRDKTIASFSKELRKLQAGVDIDVSDFISMESSEKLGGVAAFIKALHAAGQTEGQHHGCGKLFLVRDSGNEGNTTIVVRLNLKIPGI